MTYDLQLQARIDAIRPAAIMPARRYFFLLTLSLVLAAYLYIVTTNSH